MPSQRFTARYADDGKSDEAEALQLVLKDRYSQLRQLKAGLTGGVHMIEELWGLQLVPERLNIQNHNLIIAPEGLPEPTVDVTTDCIEQIQNLITQITLQL